MNRIMKRKSNIQGKESVGFAPCILRIENRSIISI